MPEHDATAGRHELVAFRVTAEIVEVLDDQDPRPCTRALPVLERGGEPGEPATDDDEIVDLARGAWRAGIAPECSVAQRVRDVVRARMLTAIAETA